MTTNILFLQKWHSLSGGVERVNVNLANAFKARSVSSHFYIYSIFGDKKEGFDKLSESQVTTYPPQSANFIKKLRHLFSYIKENKIDAIISATETANILAFFCALRFPKLAIIYTRHCAFDVSDQKLSPSKIKLLYTLYSLTNKCIGVVSKKLEEELYDKVYFGNKNVKFLPNAVLDPEITSKAAKNTDNLSYSNYFVGVGRLVEQKGFDLLLHAYKKACEESSLDSFPMIVIAGIGEQQQVLEDLANELGLSHRVIFHGYTENPYYLLNHAEAFILSSRHEGMPTVLIEAMALNTPCIAFDCPTGPDELIKDESYGLLVKNGDIDALANSLMRYNAIKNVKTEASVDQFSFPNAAESYLKEINRQLNG